MKRALILLLCLFCCAAAAAGEYATVRIKTDDNQYCQLLGESGFPSWSRADWQFKSGGPPYVHPMYAIFPDPSARVHGTYPQYAIEIGRGPKPVVVCVAVDGLNVLTGKKIDCVVTKEKFGRGYVLDRHKDVRVLGWQENARTVRRFAVVPQWKALAWWRNNSLAETGTIVVSVFRLTNQPREYQQQTVFKSLGTGAGERVRAPVRIVQVKTEPYACEVFGFRYVTRPELRRWTWARREPEFIGPLEQTR